MSEAMEVAPARATKRKPSCRQVLAQRLPKRSEPLTWKGDPDTGPWTHKRVTGFLFFFQAEDGIRDVAVTGVQTCALPICAQAGQSGGFDAAIRGEPGTPDVPKARFAESELAIGFDAFVPLAPDDFLPEFEGVFGFEEVGLPDDFGKDVEIVNLAEHVLEALEIVAPGGIVLGQKVLDGVAEALQSNTHRVPGFGFFRAQGFGVKVPGGFESFEREAFGGETPSRHEARALAQSALEALPGFLIEFVHHAERVLSQTRFVRFERNLQMR